MTIKDIEQNRDSLIESLVKEENELLKKIEKSRENNDYGLYKNLIRALTDVTTLKQREMVNIPRERWIDMFSKHKMDIDGEMAEVISIWKQKGGDIKNHRIYKVEKEIIDSSEKIGLALQGVYKKYQQYDTKKAIESVIKRKIDDNESFYDVLKSLSDEWVNLSEDNKKCISRTIAGVQNEDCFKALLDNLR